MKEIQLSQHGKNKGKYAAIIDNEDFERVNQFKWWVSKERNNTYAGMTVRINNKRSTIKMHQFIMNGKNIDHADQNGLNNQKLNLRFCTKSQNGMNRKSIKNATSIYKGVSWSKVAKAWTVQITHNKTSLHVGYFKIEKEAAIAYDKAAIKYHKEFAYLNNI